MMRTIEMFHEWQVTGNALILFLVLVWLLYVLCAGACRMPVIYDLYLTKKRESRLNAMYQQRASPPSFYIQKETWPLGSCLKKQGAVLKKIRTLAC
jgi:hypothetical protein